jgi:branched-chain amino acid transport system substrate-binding protein
MEARNRRSHRRGRRSAITVAAMITPLLLAAACSSSHGSAGGAATAGQPRATSASPALSPVKVGEIVEISGVGLNWPFQEALDKAAIRGINARGGINGHPVELDACDGRNDPDSELECARKLVSDGVVAVVGGIASTNGAAVDTYYQQHHVAAIGVNPLVGEDFNSPNQFLINSGQLGIFAGDVYNAAQHGLKKVWIMILNVPGAALAVQISKETAAKVGVDIVGVSEIPLTSTSDASYVQAAIAGGADAVMPAMGATQTAALLLALNQSGTSMKLLNLDTEPASDISGACGSGGGVCAASLGSSFSLPPTYTQNAGIKLFQQDMQAEAASGDSAAAPGTAYNDLALEGWLGMQAFAKVAATLDKVTAQTVLDGFTKAKDINLWGMIPPWTPNSSAGIKGYPRISNPYVYLTQLNSDLLPYAASTTPHDVLTLAPQLGTL